MLDWLILTTVTTTLLFGFVVFFGAPYLPTTKRQRKSAIDLLVLPKNSLIYDLGCGDGRMLVEVARAGYRAVGYELNPLLVITAWLLTRRYGNRVKVRWASLWRADLRDADAVYVFLHPRFMARLDKKLTSQRNKKNLRLVSFAFIIPGKKITAQKDGLFLYSYQPLA